MSENYEKSKNDAYWLLLAMEEAAEVTQAVSKVLRFSEARHFENLQNEVNDLMYILRVLEHRGYLDVPDLDQTIEYAENKRPNRKFRSVLRGEDGGT